MDCLWLIGQLGIAIELAGAGFLVWTSYRTTRTMKSQKVTYDGFAVAIDALLRASIRQFRDQVLAFVMIALGLAMQFTAGFKGM